MADSTTMSPTDLARPLGESDSCPLLVSASWAGSGAGGVPPPDPGDARGVRSSARGDVRGLPSPARSDAEDAPRSPHCAAFSPPRSLASRQVELVCVGVAHLDCPLFVRAAKGGKVVSARSPRSAAGPAPIVKPPVASQLVPVMPVTRPSGVSGARPADSRPLPTIIAAGILAVSLVAAFAFVSLRGGLALPTGFRPGAAASQAPSPPGSAAPTVAPTIASSPTAIPTPVSPAPASPTLAPAATASLPAAYAGLPPCPDRPDCYLYRVRSGDNLTRIADHFGITTKALKAANPEISNPNLLHVGDQLRIPLPPD